MRSLVIDGKGVPWLQLNDAGPMNYVRIAASKYCIVDSHKGKSETRDITLDAKTGRNVSLECKGTPEPSK